MNARDCTACYLCFLVVATGAWSAGMYCLSAEGNEATVSKVLLDAARTRPWFLLLFGLSLGVVLGHVFWPQTIYVETPPK